MSDNKKKYNITFIIGALAIMLAALFWSIDGLFIRPRFYSLPASLVVFWEHFLGLIVLAPFLWLKRGQIRTLSKRSWAAIAWISLFGGLIGTLFITKAFFAAIAGTVTFATVIILQKLQPVFALLLARVVLKEKLPSGFYFWAVLAIIASYFLAFAKSGLDISSINWFHNAAVFAFIAAFAFGSSTVFGKRAANHLDYRAVAGLRFALTSIFAFLLLLVEGNLYLTGQISALQWQLFALIVLTSGAGAMFVYYFGLRRVSASAATILELFWPFSALVLDYIFNHNYLSTTQFIAFLVLLFAFFKITMKGRAKSLSFSAQVVHGQGKGKGMGLPTANLDNTELEIPHGVYAVLVSIEGKKYPSLMHFGFKDLFREAVSTEILIPGFSGDLYDQKVKVKVLEKIREVVHLNNPQELIDIIEKDKQALVAISKKRGLSLQIN